MKQPLKLVLIACIYMLPVAALEVTAQFKFKQILHERAYLPLFTSSLFNKTHIRGLNDKNIARTDQYTALYSLAQPRKESSVKFSTDSYGAIQPSSFDSILKSNRDYILFCGGSTTESAPVPEGKRPPDIYQTLTGFRAVNAGLSGKNIYGCIETISDSLKAIKKKPSRIIIANNVNTLMAFGDRNKVKASTEQTASLTAKTKLILASVFPGSYELYSQLLNRLKFNHLSQAKSLPKNPPLVRLDPVKHGEPSYHPIEISLANGCCHGPALVNNGHADFNWHSPVIKERYRLFVNKAAAELRHALDRQKYPISKVYIFLEPNSFGFDHVATKYDYRQRLYRPDGQRMSLLESSKITNSYDSIYSSSMHSMGFNLLILPASLITGNDFYDAVHLAPSGSQKIGAFYAQQIPR